MRPIADSGHGCVDRALQALNLSDPTVSRSGPNAPNLVVEADALDAGQTYTFRLAVTTRNPAGTGAAEISFRVNNVRDHARSAEVVRPSGSSARSRPLCCVAFGSAAAQGRQRHRQPRGRARLWHLGDHFGGRVQVRGARHGVSGAHAAGC